MYPPPPLFAQLYSALLTLSPAVSQLVQVLFYLFSSARARRTKSALVFLHRKMYVEELQQQLKVKHQHQRLLQEQIVLLGSHDHSQDQDERAVRKLLCDTTAKLLHLLVQNSADILLKADLGSRQSGQRHERYAYEETFTEYMWCLSDLKHQVDTAQDLVGTLNLALKQTSNDAIVMRLCATCHVLSQAFSPVLIPAADPSSSWRRTTSKLPHREWQPTRWRRYTCTARCLAWWAMRCKRPWTNLKRKAELSPWASRSPGTLLGDKP